MPSNNELELEEQRQRRLTAERRDKTHPEPLEVPGKADPSQWRVHLDCVEERRDSHATFKFEDDVKRTVTGFDDDIIKHCNIKAIEQSLARSPPRLDKSDIKLRLAYAHDLLVGLSALLGWAGLYVQYRLGEKIFLEMFKYDSLSNIHKVEDYLFKFQESKYFTEIENIAVTTELYDLTYGLLEQLFLRFFLAGDCIDMRRGFWDTAWQREEKNEVVPHPGVENLPPLFIALREGEEIGNEAFQKLSSKNTQSRTKKYAELFSGYIIMLQQLSTELGGYRQDELEKLMDSKDPKAYRKLMTEGYRDGKKNIVLLDTMEKLDPSVSVPMVIFLRRF